MITLHHLERSRSHRILWLLEELDLDYKLVTYKRDPKTSMAPPELKEIHPLGKSPVITDGETVVAESGAIVEYLIEKHSKGSLKPSPEKSEYVDYLFFMHAAEGSFMNMILLSYVMERLTQSPIPVFIRPVSKLLKAGIEKKLITPNLKKLVKYVNTSLEKQKFLAGDQFTAADIQMSYPLIALDSRTSYLKKFPKVTRYIENLKKRASYKTALKKGGPVEL